jgi:hypothetical protein
MLMIRIPLSIRAGRESTHVGPDGYGVWSRISFRHDAGGDDLYVNVTSSSAAADNITRSEAEEAASLSLLAARVASTAERASRGASLTRQDQAVLRTMIRRLRAEAEAVENVETFHLQPQEPANAVAAGLTVDVVLEQEGQTTPTDSEILKILTKVVNTLEAISGTSQAESSKYAADLFRRISSLARTQAGGTGERLVGREV